MGHSLEALSGTEFIATLSAEGRLCNARPLRGTCLGAASGLCVLVESPAALRAVATSLPGQVIVLGGAALVDGILDELPVGATFAAIVVLTSDRATLARLGTPLMDVPSVVVMRALDQETVRRALRLTVTVQDGPIVVAPVPGPRVANRRRRSADGAPSTRTPGTIDLRR